MLQEDNAEKLKGLRNDYKKVFDTEEGQRVLKDLERLGMFRETIFNKEPLIMAFQEGLRMFYLHIITFKEMDIEQLEKWTNAVQERKTA